MTDNLRFHTGSDNAPHVKLSLKEVATPQFMTDHMDITHFPDQAVAFLEHHGLVHILITVMKRTLLARLSSARVTIDADPFLSPTGEDDGYRGIASAVQLEGGWLVAYHMEDQTDMLTLKESNAAGFFASIGFAAVTLNAINVPEIKIKADFPWFIKCGVAKIPKQEIPEDLEEGQKNSYAAQGCGCPSLCRVPNTDNVRCYYTDWGKRRERGVGICVAEGKANLHPVKAEWKKWNSASRRFQEAIDDGADHAIIRVVGGDAFDPHVQFIEEWQTYLMVFAVSVHAENDGDATQSGFYYSTSNDGLDWSQPRALWAGIHPSLKEGRSAAVHPSLWCQMSQDNSKSWFLIYGFTERWEESPHVMQWKRAVLTGIKSL